MWINRYKLWLCKMTHTNSLFSLMFVQIHVHQLIKNVNWHIQTCYFFPCLYEFMYINQWLKDRWLRSSVISFQLSKKYYFLLYYPAYPLSLGSDFFFLPVNSSNSIDPSFCWVSWSDTINYCIFIFESWCRRPSGPKPEIQHNRRGRGMSTLTWEEVTIREGKDHVVVVPKRKLWA